MDDAFMKIKQITGMTSLDDMLEKFIAQKVNKKNLEKEYAEVEVKLIEAKKMINKVEQVLSLELDVTSNFTQCSCYSVSLFKRERVPVLRMKIIVEQQLRSKKRRSKEQEIFTR
jgi:hypothetical protein